MVSREMPLAVRAPLLSGSIWSPSPRTSSDANASFKPNVPENTEVTTLVDNVPNPIYDPGH